MYLLSIREMFVTVPFLVALRIDIAHIHSCFSKSPPESGHGSSLYYVVLYLRAIELCPAQVLLLSCFMSWLHDFLYTLLQYSTRDPSGFLSITAYCVVLDLWFLLQSRSWLLSCWMELLIGQEGGSVHSFLSGYK